MPFAPHHVHAKFFLSETESENKIKTRGGSENVGTHTDRRIWKILENGKNGKNWKSKKNKNKKNNTKYTIKHILNFCLV